MREKILAIKKLNPEWSYRRIAKEAGCCYSVARYYLTPNFPASQLKRFNLRREINKQYFVDLLGGKCIVCKYDVCIDALDFHHIDPNKKEINIGQALRGSRKHIESEIKKCVLLCCRCHRELHAGKITIDNQGFQIIVDK